MVDPGLRRALYVLFARLLSGAPDAALYARLREGGLQRLAAAQNVDLTSDLVDEGDAEAAAAELGAEWARLETDVSLRASDYDGGADDPVAALSGYLKEHGLKLDTGAGLACDHLAVALGIMGELAGQADAGVDPDAPGRARSFYLRHIQPWSQQALAELASHAERRFYKGLAAMLSAFLESERRAYLAA